MKCLILLLIALVVLVYLLLRGGEDLRRILRDKR